MLILLLELGVSTSWWLTKLAVTNSYRLARYTLYGHIPTAEELEKEELYGRIRHLEDKVEGREEMDSLDTDREIRSGTQYEYKELQPGVTQTLRFLPMEGDEKVTSVLPTRCGVHL